MIYIVTIEAGNNRLIYAKLFSTTIYIYSFLFKDFPVLNSHFTITATDYCCHDRCKEKTQIY